MLQFMTLVTFTLIYFNDRFNLWEMLQTVRRHFSFVLCSINYGEVMLVTVCSENSNNYYTMH